MRELEYFHDLRAIPGAWLVLRVDGRSFSRLTERSFDKPFDERFHQLMLHAAERLLTELGGVYAYTESDEISVLLPRDTGLFDRELEKLVSVSAGIASAAFSLKLGSEAHFDSRLWLGVKESHVVDYFRWRQADATRCCLNGWCYWSLRKEGLGVGAATARLDRLTVAQKIDLLAERGCGFAQLPAWQRLGSGLYGSVFEKEGFNPKTGEATVATRRRVRIDESLPEGGEYGAFIRDFLTDPAGTPEAPLPARPPRRPRSAPASRSESPP